MLYQFDDNDSGLKTLDTENIDYERLCDLLGIKREKERETVRKIIRAYDLFASPDSVRTFLSKEEIVTSGKINFAYLADGRVAADSEGGLSFGVNSSFCQLMNRLVEDGLLERRLREETRFGKKYDKPVFSLNPKRVYELIH